EIDASIVVIITDGEPHPGLLATILIQRDSGGITNLLKRAAPFVDVKLFRRRIVYNNQIEKLVVIHMNKRGGETIKLFRIVDACFDAHIFKRSIWLLMVERVAFSRQSAWSTHHRHPAKLAEVRSDRARLADVGWVWRQIVEIDLHVTRNKKIETTITIVIAPAGARTPTFACNAYLF